MNQIFRRCCGALAAVAALAWGNPLHAQEATLLDLEDASSFSFTFYTYTYTAVLSQTYMTFQFRQDPAYWNLDNVSVTPLGSGTALAVNGDFEGSSTPNSFGQQVPNGWVLIGQAGLPAGGTRTTGCGIAGSACWDDGSVGGVDGLYQSFATTIGAQYTVSFWLNNTGGPTNTMILQVGASEDQGGVLVPVPPPPAATDITAAGSPHLAAGLGTTLNAVFDGGTLQLDASGPTYSQNFTVNSTNGTIDSAGLTSTLSGVLSGPGGLTFANSASGGSVTLTNINTYLGATTISAGAALALSGSGGIASSSGLADNGSFDISGTSAGASVRTLSGNGSVALGAQTLTLTNASSTFGGAINGSGGLILSGGTETLTGSSDYSGGTTISGGGILSLAADAALGAAAGALTLNGGSLATTASFATSRNVALTGAGTFNTSTGTTLVDLTGSISGAGALIKSGTGTLTWCGAISNSGGTAVNAGRLNVCGADTGTGSMSIAGGATLAVSGAGTIASASGIADNGTLDISAATAGTSIQRLSGNGAVALGAQTLTLTNASDTFAGVIGGSGGLAISGGTETLSGVDTYGGITSIGSGASLILSGAGSIAASSSIADNGTFDVSGASGNSVVQSLAGSGAVTLGARTLTLSNANDTFSGVIGGTGGLTVAGGTEVLAGSNTYMGGTAISGGATIVVASDAALGAATGALTLNGGTLATTASFASSRALMLIGDGTIDVADAVIFTDTTGAVSGAGALIKQGSGALSLCGGVSNLGGTIVAAGALTLCGIDTAPGATAIASGATLALSGAASIASSSGVADEGVFNISAISNGAAVQSLSGHGTVALGAQNLTLTNANDVFAGAIGGTGGLTITGGTETLSGSSTYSGGTRISGGARVIVASDAALGNVAGALTLNDATLEAAGSFTSTRSINLLGAATVDADPGATLTQTGAVSGNGHVTKSGDGTLVLAGDNRNWGMAGNDALGGLTINDGLVEVTNSYGLGYGLVTLNSGVIATTVDILTGQSILIGGDTVLNTDAGTTTTLTGTVETNGTGACFLKTGPGTLIVAGPTTLSNGTCVEDGRLLANGTLNSVVTVDTGGMLRGTGTINGAITVHGTLAPGNSPGTLTVIGSVTMADGSTFQDDINGTGTGNGPGNYSRLLVQGAGNQFIASGASLDLNLLHITGTAAYTPYAPQLGDSFRVVSADGGIVGRFAAFAQPQGLASGTRVAVFYDALGSNSIDLRVVPLSYATYLQGRGANSNAQSTGSALDQILDADQAAQSNAAQDQLAYTVAGLNAAQLPRVMAALSGEVHADVAAVAPEADQWLQRSVARQLDAGDADAAGVPQPGDALWMDATANKGKWRGDAQGSGFIANREQIAFGFDLLLGQPNRLGIGFSHSLTNVAASAGFGSLEENLGFVYGQVSLSPLVIDGLFGAGSSRWDTTRADPLNFTAQSLNANPHGNSSLASLGVRWPLHVGGLVLAPYVRALWQRSARDNFSEGGSTDALSGLGYEARGVRSTAGISGGSVSQSPLASVLTYQFDVGVAHDSGALSRPSIQASLQGAAIVDEAPAIGRTFVLANITGTARLGSHTYAYLGLSGEARSGKSEDLGLNAGVRTRF